MFENVFCPFSPLRWSKHPYGKISIGLAHLELNFTPLLQPEPLLVRAGLWIQCWTLTCSPKIFYLVLGFCCHRRDAVSVVLCSTAALVPAIHTQYFPSSMFSKMWQSYMLPYIPLYFYIVCYVQWQNSSIIFTWHKLYTLTNPPDLAESSFQFDSQKLSFLSSGFSTPTSEGFHESFSSIGQRTWSHPPPPPSGQTRHLAHKTLPLHFKANFSRID